MIPEPYQVFAFIALYVVLCSVAYVLIGLIAGCMKRIIAEPYKRELFRWAVTKAKIEGSDNSRPLYYSWLKLSIAITNLKIAIYEEMGA